MSHELRNIYATLPRTTRGVPLVLGGDPKGKNFLYTNGKSVIIRNLENPAIADVYSEHSQTTTVAKYSPSGFYIASADVTGKVRIWDTINKEHVLKNEFQPLGGPIKDLAWSGDNQRIVVAGEGREKFGHVFNAETCTSVGEIMGQSKALNSVDFRADRPYRIVTASEDKTLAFFHGPPFKFQFTMQDHSNFVNAVRYAPNGDCFISAGADGKAFIYDGKTGEKTGELGSPAHKAGLYAVSFSPDSKQAMTVSADKTAKIWDVTTGSVVQEYVMGTTIEDMQVGCLWQGDYAITVSLSGYINYLDLKGNKPWRVIKGHNKTITAMAVSEDRSTIYTGSPDGGICYWNASTGDSEVYSGKAHANQVTDMTVVDGNLMSVGMDDNVMCTAIDSKEYGQKTKMPSQPKKIATASGGLSVVACIDHLVVLRGTNVVFSQAVDFEPHSVGIHPGLTECAVGGGKDHKVHIFTIANDTLVEKMTKDHLGGVMDIKYSPDGAYMAACDANRKVMLYQLPDYTSLVTTEWGFHNAKVNALSWTPDSAHVASGGLDTQAVVWTPGSKSKYVIIKAAHPMSEVSRVNWLDANTLVTTGSDLRIWNIKHY